MLTLSEAVAAVRLRGDSMARACASGQWGMAALTGLRLRVVRDLVNAEAADDKLWIANINAVDQVVLGGTVAALDNARQAARRAGARRFEMLDVAVASHGPLQREHRTCGGTASFDDPAPRSTGGLHDERRRPQNSRRPRGGTRRPRHRRRPSRALVRHHAAAAGTRRHRHRRDAAGRRAEPARHCHDARVERHSASPTTSSDRSPHDFDHFLSMLSHSPIMVSRISSALPSPARWLSPGR